MARENTGFIYLASASPRRSELLAQIGLKFAVCPVNLNESRQDGESGQDYVRRLAAEKARQAWTSLDATDAPVLAADTAVVVDGEIFGKPRDQQDAVRMLAALSGREHHVYTAVSMIDARRQSHRLSQSRVRFRRISEAESIRYWQSGEPEGKAGAYAIQGRGAVLIEELRGSYSGVMGLPLFETADLLTEFGFRVL